MNSKEFSGFPVYYHIFPASFSEKGTLDPIAEQAAYFSQLGVDGILLAEDGQTWTQEEKSALTAAMTPFGLDVRWSMELPDSSFLLHQRCRRDNWEAVPYDPGEAKDLLLRQQQEDSPVVLFEHPDLPRSVSEMGNDGLYRWESASMLALVLLTLRGTVLLYQGEELGMVNPVFTLEELAQKSEAAQWLATPDAQRRSREELEAKIGRFTRLNARTVPDFHAPESGELLDWYKKLLTLRRNSPALHSGNSFPLIPEHRRAIAYTRTCGEETLLVLANLSGYAAEYPPTLERGSLFLHNYQGQMSFPGILRPYEAKLFTLSK